jgi:hypothetical protein
LTQKEESVDDALQKEESVDDALQKEESEAVNSIDGFEKL